jgi:TatA/E family protein of Tat protein translocase
VPFGFHPIELVIVFLLALLVFGPKRLPEMGSAVGKTIKEFQKSMREVKEPAPDASAALPPSAVKPAEPQQIASPTAHVTPAPEATASAAGAAAGESSKE